jgi:hypothetical protein
MALTTLVRGRSWRDDDTGLVFIFNGSHTTNVFDSNRRNVTMLTSGDQGRRGGASATEVRGHIVRWLRENRREIEMGHYRTRGTAGESIKTRWAEVRRLEKEGHPMKHPRAFVFGTGRPRKRR